MNFIESIMRPDMARCVELLIMIVSLTFAVLFCIRFEHEDDEEEEEFDIYK